MCNGPGLCSPCDIMRRPSATLATKCDVGVLRWGDLTGITLDRARAGRTAEGRSATIVADEKKSLSGIVSIRTRLAHGLSVYFNTAVRGGTPVRVTFDGFPSKRRIAIQIRKGAGIGLVLLAATACGPHAHIPLRPLNLPDVLAPTDSGALLARRLAPVLYLQRDETFPLERAVAVIHPFRRIIAYHLLWRDDVHGSWIPFTVPTDEEILWVGYDSTYAPVDLWTYWHGRVLHTPWPKSQIAVDVQWGKHGNLPRNVRLSDLPKLRSLNFFYSMTVFGEPDILLGDITRKGPLCFCHSYSRYREFTRPILLGERLDAVVRAEDPRPVLSAFFGENYSNKHWWP